MGRDGILHVRYREKDRRRQSVEDERVETLLDVNDGARNPERFLDGMRAHIGSKLAIVPTGTGEVRALKLEGGFDLGTVWVPNSSRVIICGVLLKKG